MDAIRRSASAMLPNQSGATNRMASPAAIMSVEMRWSTGVAPMLQKRYLRLRRVGSGSSGWCASTPHAAVQSTRPSATLPMSRIWSDWNASTRSSVRSWALQRSVRRRRLPLRAWFDCVASTRVASSNRSTWRSSRWRSPCTHAACASSIVSRIEPATMAAASSPERVSECAGVTRIRCNLPISVRGCQSRDVAGTASLTAVHGQA